MTSYKIFEQKLRSRNLTQTAFPPRSDDDEWVVWLWCADDPGLGAFVGAGEKYEDAFRAALDGYDQNEASPEAVEAVAAG